MSVVRWESCLLWPMKAVMHIWQQSKIQYTDWVGMGSGSRWNVLIMTYLVSHCFTWKCVCNLHRDEVDAEGLMLLKCGAREDSWESLGQQDQTSQSYRKSVLPNIHWKDWCWGWSCNTLVTWCEEVTPWKRPWCWERLRAGGERDDKGWDDWMVLPTQWIWVWARSRSRWWTGKPDVLQSVWLQRVRHDWETELNWDSYFWSVLFRSTLWF